MRIKKWLFSTLILCSTVSAAPLHNQPFATWLAKEMAEKHVPGVSIAVIKNYEVEWAKGFGIANKKSRELVTPNILFQAASLSKPVTAMAALKAVQDGELTLNKNINEALNSWKVPDNQYTDKEKVTLSRLLSHTAGINVPGFTGYAQGEKKATLIEALNGAEPANSKAIRVSEEPGSHFKYSGGGYTIVQQVLIDVYEKPFVQVMQQLVLNPLRMSNSTFEQPLPTGLKKKIAMPYRPNGTSVVGGPHVHPEQAAAGLWTTPTDLAKFVISIQKSLRGDSGEVLNQHFAQLLAVTPVVKGTQGDMALGLIVNLNKYGKAVSHGNYFGATGENQGYSSFLIGSAKSGNGLIIMTNMSVDRNPSKHKKAQPNWALISAVVKKIAQADNWN